MSDTEEYTQGPIDVAFTRPMIDAMEPPKEEPEPFTDVKDAAALRSLPEDEIEPTPIIYRQAGGEHAGEPSPPEETVSAEQAARNLANYRNNIAAETERQSDQLTAEVIDAARAARMGQPIDQQAQASEPVEAPPAEPQLPPEQVPPGVDPELARAIEQNPRLREALHSEVQQIEAAKQTYLQGLQQNAQAAAASLFAAYPELQGLTSEQLPGAIKVINQQNPQRAADILDHIQRTNSIVGEWQKSQAAQYQEQLSAYKNQFNQFAHAEDEKLKALVPELGDKESSRKLGEATVETLKGVGFTADDLQRAWNGEVSLSLRDHRAQLLLIKAARYDAAMANAAKNAVKTAPPVQRPGVSGSFDHGDDSKLSELNRRLSQTGSYKDAARLLIAKRANNR